MVDLRDGFRDIVSGWTLINDVEVLGEYIERAAVWRLMECERTLI
jgi:hypothetical protein